MSQTQGPSPPWLPQVGVGALGGSWPPFEPKAWARTPFLACGKEILPSFLEARVTWEGNAIGELMVPFASRH